MATVFNVIHYCCRGNDCMNSQNECLGRRIRVALVGGGGDGFIGKVHAIASTMDRRAELVAGALSSNPETARTSAVAMGIGKERGYESFEALIAGELACDESERIDLVAIATPNHTHYPFASAALKAGFHVVCDKPLTTKLTDAEALASEVHTTGKILALTHNYSGYPLIRQARAMVASGEIGDVIAVRVEYLQGWKQLQTTGTPKRGAWKSNPELAGPAGTMADVGTHAFHLARYVTCFPPERLTCHMRQFCDESLDDYGLVTLSSAGGPLMSVCVSQVSHGRLNDLRIDVDGTKGAISWRQEEPNSLIVRRQGQPLQVYERHPAAEHMHDAERSACRIPPGHPEAFYEAFANIYCGVYDDIVSLAASRPLQQNYPTVQDGVEGVKFIERCVQSAAADAEWVEF